MPADSRIPIQSSNMYYPYGSLQPGRYSQTAVTSRYGFNGMEKDNEIKGDGNSLEFKFRIYNSRIGKFLSVDPLAPSFPWNSSYPFAENDVIRSIDLEGLEKFKISDIIDSDGYPLKVVTLLELNSDYEIIDENNQSRQDFKYLQIQRELGNVSVDPYNDELILPTHNRSYRPAPGKIGDTPEFLLPFDPQNLEELDPRNMAMRSINGRFTFQNFNSVEDVFESTSFREKSTKVSDMGFTYPARIDAIDVGLDQEFRADFEAQMVEMGYNLDNIQIRYVAKQNNNNFLEIDFLQYDMERQTDE